MQRIDRVLPVVMCGGSPGESQDSGYTRSPACLRLLPQMTHWPTFCLQLQRPAKESLCWRTTGGKSERIGHERAGWRGGGSESKSRPGTGEREGPDDGEEKPRIFQLFEAWHKGLTAPAWRSRLPAQCCPPTTPCELPSTFGRACANARTCDCKAGNLSLVTDIVPVPVSQQTKRGGQRVCWGGCITEQIRQRRKEAIWSPRQSHAGTSATTYI